MSWENKHLLSSSSSHFSHQVLPRLMIMLVTLHNTVKSATIVQHSALFYFISVWPLTPWALQVVGTQVWNTVTKTSPLTLHYQRFFAIMGTCLISSVQAWFCPISSHSEMEFTGSTFPQLSCLHLIPYSASCPSSASVLISEAEGFNSNSSTVNTKEAIS